MKKILFTLFMFTGTYAFAQSANEAAVLKLSGQVFKWEVEGRIDLLEKTFDDKFVVVSATGEQQTKADYLKRLRSGSFTHNSIVVEENSATVTGNTGIVVGKGTFIVTVSGRKATIHLSYIEVFTRAAANKQWVVLAMHASTLPNVTN
jgi:hypothetical protein